MNSQRLIFQLRKRSSAGRGPHGLQRCCGAALIVAIAAASWLQPCAGFAGEAAIAVAKCNVVWDSPSADSWGSMPIGNGDIGANVWVEPSGDLVLLLSKSDA